MRRALACLWLTMDFLLWSFPEPIGLRGFKQVKSSRASNAGTTQQERSAIAGSNWRCEQAAAGTGFGCNLSWLLEFVLIYTYIIYCFSLGCIPAVMDDSAMFSGFSMHFKAWLRVYFKKHVLIPGRPGSSWTLQENWCIQRVAWLHPWIHRAAIGLPWGCHGAAMGDPHRTVPGAFGIEQFMLLSWRWLFFYWQNDAEPFWIRDVFMGCHMFPWFSMVHIGSPFRQGKTCNIGWVRVGQPWRLCSEGIAWRKSGMGGYEGSDVLQPALATCIHST